MKKKVLVVFIVLSGLICGLKADYNRSLLQQKFPGYGVDFIFFAGPDDKPIKVYLKENHTAESRLFGDSDIEEKVNFTFYSRKVRDGRTVKSVNDISSIFDKNKPTKFVTHGYMSSGSADTCQRIKDGFLQKYDANVFIMDWGAIAKNIIYPIPMNDTPKVARIVTGFLQRLIDQLKANPKDIHLVGHSLGAHVFGFAGRDLKTKVARITGLDPALPGFDVGVVPGGHLTKNDADFVDVIHTCAGFLGYKLPLGHVDFYPNGGTPPQPGCSILWIIESCSHGRSWKLFADSLTLKTPYLAKQCGGFTQLQDKKCDSKDDIEMGDPTPTSARGIYYLKTTDKEPFVINSSK